MFNVRGETEVATSQMQVRQRKISGRFLRGPIPMPDIIAATRLSGKALPLLLAMRHQMDLSGKAAVSVPKSLLYEMGIDRDSKSRGLRQLENAGLIQVERVKGRSAIVRLSPAASQQR